MRTLAIAVAIAACSSDPTLHVTVVHPTDMKVTSTTITVYDSKNFTCEDIEYAKVDASALAAAQVAQEVIDATGSGSGSLANLSRSDNKMIVAQGYDDTGRLVAAGCADKGVVSGAATVEIDTVAAASVSLTIADLSGADFYGIATTVTDVNGKAMDGRQVWWRVFGPSGFMPSGDPSALNVQQDYWEPQQPTCTKKGNTTIHPVPPALIGGFAVEVHVAWAADPPQLFTSFTKFADVSSMAPAGSILVLSDAGAVSTQAICTRHVASGKATLACLDGATTITAYDVNVTYSMGSTTFAEGASNAVPQTAIGLFGVDNGSARDVYVGGSDCSVTGIFGAPAGKSGSCTGADDVRYVPACGNEHPLVLFHIPKGAGPSGSIIAVDQTTGAAAPLALAYHGTAENDVAFTAVGCITELDPTGGPATQRQLIVLDYGDALSASALVNTSSRALYGCPTSCSALQLPISGQGVTFLAENTESRAVITTVDATGVELSQIVLLSDASGDKLVERERHPAASAPDLIVSGSFDNDSYPDLLWDFSSSKRGTTFEVSYARMVEGNRLTALSGSTSAQIAQIFAGDITNDQHDDITLISTSTLLPAKRFVSAIPLQVPPPALTLMTDPTCAP